jgi:hypothetical protein
VGALELASSDTRIEVSRPNATLFERRCDVQRGAVGFAMVAVVISISSDYRQKGLSDGRSGESTTEQTGLSSACLKIAVP